MRAYVQVLRYERYVIKFLFGQVERHRYGTPDRFALMSVCMRHTHTP